MNRLTQKLIEENRAKLSAQYEYEAEREGRAVRIAARPTIVGKKCRRHGPTMKMLRQDDYSTPYVNSR